MIDGQPSPVVDGILDRLKNLITQTTVFGEPVERGGVTLIPASKVIAGGGGTDDRAGAKGDGGGAGMIARPAGAYIIRDDRVTWKPAVTVEGIVLAVAAGVWLVARLRR